MSDPSGTITNQSPAQFCRHDTGSSVGNPFVSEGGLGHRPWCCITDSVMYHHSNVARRRCPDRQLAMGVIYGSLNAPLHRRLTADCECPAHPMMFGAT